MEKKPNVFVRFFSATGRGIKNFFFWIIFGLAYIFVKPFFRCKVKGKENIKSTSPKIFIANHYEIYGPLSMFLKFPYKFRPWVIDKMLDPKAIKEQMGLGIYSHYKKVPMWMKRFVVNLAGGFMIFVLKRAKAISVSRENARANIKTMNESIETLNKGTNILIFPEYRYVEKGVGTFQTGFEHLGKYYYQKTKKCVEFYPVFISMENKEMYIGEPITFNPNNDTNNEKEKIVNFLHSSMINMFEENEIKNPPKKRKNKQKNIKK